MGWLDEFLFRLMNGVTGGLRKFVAFAVFMFFFGTLYGIAIERISERFFIHEAYLIAIPLVLGLLAYVSTEFAALLFILMLGFILLVFL